MFKQANNIEEIKPVKIKKLRIRIMYILLGIFIVVAVACAVGLGYELYTSNQGRTYYSNLAAEIETRPRVYESLRPIAPPVSPTNAPDGAAETGEVPVPDEYVWVPYVDFDALSERFPGIVAWIRLEGTALDYPLMQGTDNYFFLGHLPDGTSHRNGSVFLDNRNNADLSDRNSLIYGHESRTGDMFGMLKNYRQQTFYEENPVINIYTASNDYELLLFAGYLVDSGVEAPSIIFRDDAAFERYIADLKRRSFFRSDVEVGVDDRIVSLCTCAYDYTNARWVIVGKLVDVSPS